jgi:ribosomal protein S18 acetylase RimI-like enzyme
MDYRFRTFQDDDIPFMVEMINTYLRETGDPPVFTEEMLRHQISSPMVDPQRDGVIVEGPTGERVGILFATLNPRTGSGGMTTVVSKKHENQGIEERLLQRGEAILRGRFDEVPADKPVFISSGALETRDSERERLQRLGYHETRRFYEMVISLTEPLAPVPMPVGLEMRPFDREAHARAVHLTHQEAFRDHWGHHEDQPFDEWARRMDSPDVRGGDLFVVVWDGDEPAGAALNSIRGDDQGWIDILAVRRPWRGRGLGKALLRQSFYVFQQRGITEVGLGVDSVNPTGAVELYERAGMHVKQCQIIYRKVLRGDEADIVD